MLNNKDVFHTIIPTATTNAEVQRFAQEAQRKRSINDHI